jgi:hypothetical protein
VSEVGSVLGSSGSLGDVTLPGESTTGVIGTVAFTTLLAGLPKKLVARAAAALVTPDVAVDGLMADEENAGPAEPSRDLLWTPFHPEMLDHDIPVLGGEALVASRSRASPTSEVVRECRPIDSPSPILRVAADLTADRAAVAPQDASDLSLRTALFA